VTLISELATTLAHELNQPLGAIHSNAETAQIFLKSDPPNFEELRAILSDIRQDAWRGGEVIHRMRSLLKKTGVQAGADRNQETDRNLGDVASGRDNVA
jgi:signal transduction histidine kinase